ncbi:MAG: hypothetical protein Q8O52_08040 [Sulfuritalea sp.]|nr:hypothetical protein [Sulfuritalea sp.]
MSALDHARGLLLMARTDFDAMRGMIGNPLFADEVFGFHAQQTVEKSLKAWLAGRGRCRCQSFLATRSIHGVCWHESH